MKTLFARLALLPEGWARDVAIEITPHGHFGRIERGALQGDDEVVDIAMPGFCNIHSHAFQRALAGRAEHTGGSAESFWSWRDGMYALAARLAPPDVYAIARQLYIELLRSGYTAVGEFHYLHHRPDGARYRPAATMALSLARAASDVGIDLTLLPVLYQRADMAGTPLTDTRRRFACATGEFVDLYHTLRERLAGSVVGVGIHSLRAVELGEIFRLRQMLGTTATPWHIHVAEQPAEVEECLARTGRRPLALLLDEGLVDEHWCLVHATHATEEELARLAQSGAVAGLCPSTEANLADGIFGLRGYLEAGGHIGVGSDSQVGVDPFEELRLLEYAQRLVTGRRNRAVVDEGAHCGETLVRRALTGGARALGQPAGEIATGRRASLLEIGLGTLSDGSDASGFLLDQLVFAPRGNPVRNVMVGGRWVIREGRHALDDAAQSGFRAVLRRLYQ